MDSNYLVMMTDVHSFYYYICGSNATCNVKELHRPKRKIVYTIDDLQSFSNKNIVLFENDCKPMIYSQLILSEI